MAQNQFVIKLQRREYNTKRNKQYSAIIVRLRRNYQKVRSYYMRDL